MDWVCLFIAGLFEFSGVLYMNKFQLNRSWQNLLLMLLGFGISLFLLSLAMKTIPMGTAYAIWTGIGASGGALVGMIFYGESRDWRRIFFLTLILAAVIGLKLIS